MHSVTLLAAAVGTLTGIAANLLTSFVTNVVLPAYRKYVYRDVLICGAWVIETVGDPLDGGKLAQQWSLVAILEQRANNIEGSATATTHRADDTKTAISYEVTGHIYDRIVNLNFRAKDRGLIAHSTFLVEVVRDGSEMLGIRLFHGLRCGNIRSIECKWLKGASAAQS